MNWLDQIIDFLKKLIENWKQPKYPTPTPGTPGGAVNPPKTEGENPVKETEKQFPILVFVNPNSTPTYQPTEIKAAGGTGIVLKVSRIVSSPYYYMKILPDAKKICKALGLEIRAWLSGNVNNDNTRMNSAAANWKTSVNEIIAAVKEIAKMGIPIHIDLDTGEANKNIQKTTTYIKKLREATPGTSLSITVMPHARYYDDSTQYGEDYKQLSPLVDILSPELYGFSYTNDPEKMAAAVKSMVKIAPNLMPALQIISDSGEKLTDKEIREQIKTCKSHMAKGVFLFRWYGKPIVKSETQTNTTTTTDFKPDGEGCYNSPRFLEDSNMFQNDDTWCGLNVIQQIFKELFNILVLESDLYKYGYTGSGGTAPADLKKIIIAHAKKLGHEVTIEVNSLESLTWKGVGERVANPDIGVFFHENYKQTWGHYDYCVSVCPINIYMANSLEGKVIGYSRGTVESWFRDFAGGRNIYSVRKVK